MHPCTPKQHTHTHTHFACSKSLINIIDKVIVNKRGKKGLQNIWDNFLVWYIYILLTQTGKIEVPQIIFEDTERYIGKKSLKGFIGEEEGIKGCDESLSG